MPFEVIHHGGAIRFDARVLRLKDLLPADELGAGDLRIQHAERVGGDGGDAVRLTLNDGRCSECPLPRDAREGAADLVVRNAGQILTLEGAEGVGLVVGATAVACREGRILGLSREDRVEATFPVAKNAMVVDAKGGVVTPGLVDPHTHPVFAGQRAVEFGMKARGQSYLDIHKAGGGILSTVKATRQATFEELCAGCAGNLNRLLAWGVTTCEGKSGYDLTLDGELRMLEVLRTVGDCHPVDVVPTLLGAHALPPELASERETYVALVAEQMVPRAAAEGLARYCDAYCEDGAFTPAEVERIFTAAKDAGLSLRIHAEQFTDQGGALLAARMGAASADHLEAISPAAIEAMAASGTTAVLLPGAALACRCPWPPARDILDAGVDVALGTDLNPGSSMTSSLPLMMSLASMQMGMSCEESWRAVTVTAARALGLEDRVGSITPGRQADLVVFDAPDYRYIPYHYGDNHARVVIKRGRVVVNRS
jgi:imidazolonepropionase